MVPGKPESFFEIGYILLGRKSIFMICSIIIFNSVIGTTPVLILAAKTCSEFFVNLLTAFDVDPSSEFYKIMER
tara:strand:+ start:315 stop:536 length:222 start_codon:yes stop_codon:yes gene_type:complete